MCIGIQYRRELVPESLSLPLRKQTVNASTKKWYCPEVEIGPYVNRWTDRRLGENATDTLDGAENESGSTWNREWGKDVACWARSTQVPSRRLIALSPMYMDGLQTHTETERHVQRDR